jgi:type I restriction enzyme S subunit
VISNSRTATMTTINQADLSRILVPLPALSEQARIAELLREKIEDAERNRKTLEDEVSLINALPALLLRRAFSGEL